MTIPGPIPKPGPSETRPGLARLEAAIGEREPAGARGVDGGFIGSDLAVVDRALARIQSESLARGPLFCDWGSGLGAVCAVAAINGFSPLGIEIQSELVASARSLARDLGLDMSFAQGTFLLPGDEDLASGSENTRMRFDGRAWDALALAPGDCDVVFAYPWPGEEACIDGVFRRHASPGALLVTFHDWDYLLVQRKVRGETELASLGWM